ncbi:FIG01019486: hypothetical protein [hydrothermal vent metagenome]|uniref:Lipoprotein n=1 Tax=hydrothermal vent metagenome TaxID=652676 RepID=A0A3B0TSS2_9ZZZZ
MKNEKKQSLTIAILMVLVLFFSSCHDDETQKPKEEVVEAPSQVIPIKLAKTAYDAYAKRRVPLIQRFEDSINLRRDYGTMKQQKRQQNKNKLNAQTDQAVAPFDVARYVYYDYETIKQYMAYIEQESKLAGVEISTLRFYFSNYPDETFFENDKDSIFHPRQNSLLISPTVKKGKADYIFYIDDTHKEKPRAVILSADFGPMKGFETGDANLNGNEENRSFATFVPSFMNTKAPLYQSGKSLTMNRGAGIPPTNNE